MYELDTVSLHNWYLVDAQDVPVSGHTAIIGQTGAGKSSLLDAIQTVVSGNNRNVIELNAAAGEKRDRTVRDYVVGCVSDVEGGKPRRERCETTLALSFRDTATGHAISIGLMMTADADQPSEETTRRFVTMDHAFRISDFVEQAADGTEYVVSHETMMSRMRRELGPKRFETFPNSTKFVGEFLQRMRPRMPPNARQFLRSFGNAMMAKEISDPTEFVRRFVLEPLPLNVRRVQDSIRTWRDLEEEVHRLEGMLVDLRDVRSRFATGFRRKIEDETDAFLDHHIQRLDLELKAAEHEENAHAAEQAETSAKALVANHEREVAALDDEILTLRATLKGSAAAAQLEAIGAKERAAAAMRVTVHKALAAQVKPWVEAADLQKVRKNLPISLHGALGAAVEFAQAVRTRPPQDWTDEAERLGGLARAALPLSGALESLTAQRNDAAARTNEVEGKIRALAARIQAAGTTGSVLSEQTTAFVQELRRANVDAVPLPEVVEVEDESWAFALEALLGPNREALIVAPEDAEHAHDILHRHRNHLDGCRLVDTRKTRTLRRQLPEGSIAAVAITDDPDARAFIDQNVAHFVRAETAFDLSRHAHAILRNGRTTSGAALRVFRDRQPILGKAARVRAALEARREHSELLEDLDDLKTAAGLLDAAIRRVSRLAEADPAELDRLLAESSDAQAEIAGLQRQRAAVETEDDRRLRDEIKEVEERRKAYMEELGQVRQEAADARARIGTETRAAEDARQQASRQTTFEARVRALQESPEARRLIDIVDAAEHTAEAAEARLRTHLDFTLEARADRRRFLAAELQRLHERRQGMTGSEARPGYHLNRASNMLVKFFGDWQLPSPLGEADHESQFFWVIKRADDLENNELRPYRDQVQEARAEMETALKEDLLTKLDDNFQWLDVQLKILNERLGQYTFVGQRYMFTRSINVAMKPIHDLVKKVVSLPERGLMGLRDDAAAPDDGFALAMADVERLVSEEADTRRFEDYRQYFQFELMFIGRDEHGREKPPEPFSRIAGKLSGGQRQAPYYVAIAASMVSSYYPKAKTGEPQGMGLVVFDEAFNKLDVPNTHALMNLFRSLGLQVVVAAPEEKRTSLIECVDSLINVNRAPGTPDVFIDTVVIGPKARDAMLRENPVHRGIEAFRVPAATDAPMPEPVD